MSSIYEPLDVESYQIRILCLQPGNESEVVRCNLEIVNLTDGPRFVALSYEWGNSSPTTKIIVNGMDTSVTENLQNALRRLRTMEVERVWADALCINQSDNREKSLQVRMMKQIYSVAFQTFAWLGEPGGDGAAAAIASMKTASTELCQQSDSNAPPQICTCAALPRTEQGQDIHLDCINCRLQLTLQNIADLFNRGFWRRRWIVQEIAASEHVQFGCGDKTISFRDIQEAVNKYALSTYWTPRNDDACRYFRKIARLRELHHLAGALSLVEALVETQDFLSENIRDTIFAIVGIGYDGADLIPSTDYRQCPENIARDFTRSLIRRNGCFNIITADQYKRSRSDNLPTWTPNWLSRDLPNDGYFIDCTRPGWVHGRGDENQRESARPPLLSLEFRQRSLSGGPNVLMMEGVVIGTINYMTSTMSATPGYQSFESEHYYLRGCAHRSPIHYYGGTDEFVTALLKCIIIQEGDWWQIHSVKYIKRAFTSRRIVNGIKILLFNDVLKQAPDCRTENLHGTREVFTRWLSINERFLIDNKPLQNWLSDTITPRWVLRHMARKWREDIQYLIGVVIFLDVVTTLGLVLSKPFQWPFWIMYASLGLLFINSVAYLIDRIRRKALPTADEITNGMLFTSKRPGRLVICDTGILGMGCPYAKTGDKICLLAGYSSAAVLRRRQDSYPNAASQQTAYEVVGIVTICLSEKDGELWAPFLITQQMTTFEGGLSSYESRIDDLRRTNSAWQEFILV